jgi:hypothetical protein
LAAFYQLINLMTRLHSKNHTYEIVRKLDSGASFDAFLANKVDSNCPEMSE